MKLKVIVVLATALAFGWSVEASACGDKAAKSVHKTAPKDASTVVLAVKGMSCIGCADKITSELQKLDGVYTAKVDYKKEQAAIKYTPNRVNVAKLVQAVKKLGFEVKVASGARS